MSQSTEADTEPDRGSSGFTLIEVLVALVIVATALTSIGGLMATAARGVRSVESQSSMLDAVRGVIAAMPDRSQLQTGVLSGSIYGQQWSVTVMPFDAGSSRDQANAKWSARPVVITVRSPSGKSIHLETVRLQTRGGG